MVENPHLFLVFRWHTSEPVIVSEMQIKIWMFSVLPAAFPFPVIGHCSSRLRHFPRARRGQKPQICLWNFDTICHILNEIGKVMVQPKSWPIFLIMQNRADFLPIRGLNTSLPYLRALCVAGPLCKKIRSRLCGEILDILRFLCGLPLPQSLCSTTNWIIRSAKCALWI